MDTYDPNHFKSVFHRYRTLGAALSLVLSTLLILAALQPPLAHAGISGTAIAVYGQSDYVTGTPANGTTGLYSPFSVAKDSTGVYVADRDNNRVLFYPAGQSGRPTATRVYGQSDFTTTTPHAGGATGLNNPYAVTLDSSGVYIADTNNNRVLYYVGTSTTATRVYGQTDFTNIGAGTSATTLRQPRGVAVDSSGNVYVADSGNNRVLFFPTGQSGTRTATRVYGQLGSFINKNAGTTSQKLTNPYNVAVNSSGVYVADLGNNRVLYFAGTSTTATRVYGQGGSFTTAVAGTGATKLDSPNGVSVDSTGVYVADSGNDRVLFYNGTSTTVTSLFGNVVGSGPTANTLNAPAGIISDLANNTVYVADQANNRVLVIGTPLKPPTDLAIALTHTGTFTQGQSGTYPITVTNNGPNIASGPLQVVDTLPTGITYTSVTGTGWSCSASGQTVTCTNPSDLAVNTVTNLSLTVTIDATAASPSTDTATVTSPTPEFDVSNNTATDTTTVIQETDLAITMTHTGSFAQAHSGVYTITVTNNGPWPAVAPIQVVDTLPTGFSYNSVSGGDWICSANGSTVTCTSATDLANPGTSSFDLTVDVNANAGSPSVNTATVSSASVETDLSNNTATDPTTVTGPNAVSLVAFTATSAGQTITVQWTTATELNTLGFNLYRSTDGKRSDAVRVTSNLIPAQGNSVMGSSYTWTDPNVRKGVTYAYWLQETETSGQTNEYGPTAITFGSYHILLPLIGMGSMSR